MRPKDWALLGFALLCVALILLTGCEDGPVYAYALTDHTEGTPVLVFKRLDKAGEALLPAEPIAHLRKGDKVLVIGIVGEFAWVRLSDGQEGYVYSCHLGPEPPQ